jgi:hypothetical protein
VATTANELTRPARRSTRIERAIPITITGVDAWRGPYVENVSTLNVSAHGCNYFSAHQVLNGSLVIIELQSDREPTPRSTRGHVKYVKRPAASGQPFQTGIEFEDPGNVWGIDDPPKDWLAWTGPKTIELDTSKAKPFAVPRPEPEAPSADEKNEKPARTTQAQPLADASAGATPVALVVGGFQQQLEKMLTDAAAIVVQEKTKATFEQMRASLREEIKSLMADTMKTHADAAIQASLRRLELAAKESTQALHAQWSKRVESEVQAAHNQIQERKREMEEVSQALSLSALEKLQNVVEKSRQDSVDRIIARLKDQSAPLLGQVQKTLVELNKGTQEASAVLSRALEESRGRIKELHEQLNKQFEKAICNRLEAAEAEFERAARGLTIQALHDLRGLSQKHEAETKARLQSSLEPIMQESLATVREKAAETSQQFAGELEDYSRSHLEFVGGAISELAKGLRKKTRE